MIEMLVHNAQYLFNKSINYTLCGPPINEKEIRKQNKRNKREEKKEKERKKNKKTMK